MAYTEGEMRSISNSELATAQDPPIRAVKHRTVNNALIDELYDAQSMANKLAALNELGSPASGDLIFVIRGGVGYLIDAATLDFVQNFTDLSDVSITTPNDGDIVYYNGTTGKFETKTLSEVSGGVIILDSRDDLPVTGMSDVLYITKGGEYVDLVIDNPNFDGSIAPWFTIDDGGNNLTYISNYIRANLNPGQTTRFVRQSVGIHTVDRNTEITFGIPIELYVASPFASYQANVEVALFYNSVLVTSFTKAFSGTGGILNTEYQIFLLVTGIGGNLVFDEIAFRLTNQSANPREVRFGTLPNGVSVRYIPKQSEFYYWTGTEYVNVYTQKRTVQVNTNTSSIVLDFKGGTDILFVYSAPIESTTNIDYANDENAVSYKFLIEVTDLAGVIYFPANTICNSATWSTGQLWTPPYTGKFKFKAEYDGVNWWLEVNEAFI